MKRVLVGFCLSLIIILVDGYDQLYAGTPRPGIFATIQHSHNPLVRIGMPCKEKGIHMLESVAIEEQDDQFNTLKKYLQSRCQLAALFMAQALRDLIHESVQGPTFSEPPPYPLSPKSSAILQVFRI